MPSFDRRAMIAGALSVGALSAASLPRPARAALPVPAGNALHFNILRNGKPFGKYQVGFVTSGDQLTVTTDVAMNMQIAKITVFDYRHHCEEIWRGGRFVELHSHSIRDNKPDQAQMVNAVRTPTGISVTNKAGLVALPLSSNPLTHWNSSTLPGQLFNPEDVYLLSLTAQSMGHDGFPLASGAAVNGSHWALRGSQTVDEWYDDAGVWMGLRGVFPDKSVIEYRRV
jgi:hypothetical protein